MATGPFIIAKGTSLGAKLPTVTKTGFSFDKWVNTSNNSTVTSSTNFTADANVKALWTADANTILINLVFDLNLPEGWEGEPPEAIGGRQVASGAAIGALTSPADIEGYIFDAWYTTPKDGGEKVDGNKIFTATTSGTTVTLYARWTELDDDDIIITFMYNAANNDSTIHARVTVKEGEAIGEEKWPEDPTREGYSFVEWTEFSNGQGRGFTFESTSWPTGANNSTKDTVWAKWHYDGVVETDDPPEGWITAGIEKVTSENNNQVLYRFDLPENRKWSDYVAIAADFAAGPSNLNGGGSGKVQVNSVRLYGNYTFDQLTRVDMTYENATMHGQSIFVGNYNTIGNGDFIFNNEGGATSEDYRYKTMKQLAALFGKADLEAWEWFTVTQSTVNNTPNGSYKPAHKPGDNDTGPFYFTPGISGNAEPLTFYIKNVMLVGDIGIDNVIAVPLVFKAGDETFPAFVGYTSGDDGKNGLGSLYRGWADGSPYTDTVNVGVTITKNYNWPTGSGTSPTSDTVEILTGGSLSSADLAEPATSPADLVFKGWFDAATGGNLITTSNKFTADKPIYAQWASEIEITINLNYTGAPPATKVTIASGGTLGAVDEFPANPVRDGYFFTKWYTDDTSESGDPVTANTIFTAAGTIYAHWVESISITFNYNDEGTTANKVIKIAKNNTFNGSATLVGSEAFPTNPARSGFIFLGWFEDADNGTGAITATTSFAADKTATAKWKALVMAPQDFVFLNTTVDPVIGTELPAGPTDGFWKSYGNPELGNTVIKITFPEIMIEDPDNPGEMIGSGEYYDISSYTKYTIDAKFFKGVLVGDDPATNSAADKYTIDEEIEAGWGLGQVIWTKNVNNWYDNRFSGQDQYNLGKETVNAAIKEALILGAADFDGIVLQNSKADVKFIQVTKIIFHK